MNVIRLLKLAVRRTWGWFWRLVGLLLLLFVLQRSVYPLHIRWNAISVIVGSDKFDYVGWELNALATKLGQAAWGVHPYMSEPERSQYVRDYLQDVQRVRQLEAEIDAAYLNATSIDPDALTAGMQQERDRLRNDLEARQPLAESILEGQVSAVLADEGFATLGQVLPPVSMHLTRVPQLLVVSPRDRIEREVELAVDPMTVEQRDALENRIAEQENMDALVVPLGGMALFPAMIQESGNLPWVVETFAHEWLHHYFFLYPLGRSFFIDTGPTGREALAINETAANIFGREVGRKVLERYYPDFLPSAERSDMSIIVSAMRQPNSFNFAAAMHRTRTTVDEMLLIIDLTHQKTEAWERRGNTQQAEQLEAAANRHIERLQDFMGLRQRLFVENGYGIRKLNLAYFAFYGGYQSGGVPGIAGNDPIGPAVEDIFAMSTDLQAFVRTLRTVTTREELLNAHDAMRADAN